jgi:septum formation protein
VAEGILSLEEGLVSPLILASGSARRATLLEQAGVPFEVSVREIDESVDPGEDAVAYARRMAQQKADAAFEQLDACKRRRPLLAADTVVVARKMALGKPKDRADAKRMIETLAGGWHEVVTAFCILHRGQRHLEHVTTEVHFRALSRAQVERYLDRAAWHDKAGAYAIQGEAAFIVSEIRGSHSNVIGLPICEVVEALEHIASEQDDS